MFHRFSLAMPWPAIAVRAMLAAALLFGGSMAATSADTTEAATPALKVTVYCYSTRERTVIKNQSSKTITIRTVGSIYKPYSTEPFYVSKALGAGKTITYYTGSGATWSSSKTLTRRSIYNNAVGTREGARVKTTTGKSYTDKC
jgi:hypothetical protein